MTKSKKELLKNMGWLTKQFGSGQINQELIQAAILLTLSEMIEDLGKK